MRARIFVRVKPDSIGYAEPFVYPSCGRIQGRPHEFRAENPVVYTVDKQRRTGREHRGEGVVVRHGAEIDRRLFQVAVVLPSFRRPVPDRGVPGNRHADANAFIDRREHGGLPPAAREAGHGHPFRIGIFVREQNVQSAFHGQVHGADAGHAAQVDVGLVHVVKRTLKFPHADKFEVQGKHAASGQVDAPRLLVVHGLAAAMVTVRVEHGRHLALEILGLVEQRRDPHARISFVVEFPDTIAVALEGAPPADGRRAIVDGRIQAGQVDFLQQVPANSGGSLLPFRGGHRRFQARQLFRIIVHHDAGMPAAQEFARKRVFDLPGRERHGRGSRNTGRGTFRRGTDQFSA